MKRLLFILLLLPVFAEGQIITTIAGSGSGTYSGEGGAATAAHLGHIPGITFDFKGNLYLAIPLFYRVVRIDTGGIVTTFAGTGTTGFAGDNGPATDALLGYPACVAADAFGNIYISDASNKRIRKVDTAGIIKTFAGNGLSGYSGDGVPATSTSINTPQGLNFDKLGRLFVADYNNNRIRRIDTTGIITTVAGNGTYGYTGDSGPATNAEMKNPSCVVLDTSGNIYIGDWGNNRVRKVDVFGTISTVVGNGVAVYNGEGISATTAQISVWGIALDDSDNLFIADHDNERVRKVSILIDTINTIAGTGTAGFSGDGGPATAGMLYYPEGLAFDNCGNLFIADLLNSRIRKVTYNPSCGDRSSLNSVALHFNTAISLYPNPTNTSLTLTSNDRITTIDISNLLGQVVYSHQYNAQQVQLDVAALPAGIYILKINESEVRRFVKE
jgi:sugar lactone lactonase YvrE